MFYRIKKNAVSNYPVPKVGCSVLLFLKEEDGVDEQKAVYWMPFEVNLSECLAMTPQEIDEMIKVKGDELFNKPENQTLYASIELGATLTAPEVIV
jgi:hypothetical protein